MKTGIVEIRGKEYITALSTRVMFHIQDKSGKSVKEELEHIIQDNDIKDLFWFLHEMMVAGDIYATAEHIEHNTPPTFDELIDSVGVDDYEEMFSSLSNTISNGMTPDLDATSKNAPTALSVATD